MVQHYEPLVQPSVAITNFSIQHDDDPLIHWLSYIKFHQEFFASYASTSTILGLFVFVDEQACGVDLSFTAAS